MPKVSFVIPVWDGDSYLSETLETIRNQTEKDIEIIVVDDCSPDFTAELMDWYRKQDERIVYHRFETNQGVCAARNYGNSIAKADIICVSDQDDPSMPWRADFTYRFLTKQDKVDCITSSYHECNVDGVPKQLYVPHHMTRELFEGNNFVWMHSSCAYRRKDILEIPYRVEDTKTDDYVFLDDWTKAGKKFWTVKKVLANCRRLPFGVMNIRRKVQGVEPSYIL